MFEDIDPEQAKFLEDLDQWDQESQEILLDLAHNNQFITFKEMDKGIYGKGVDPFRNIRIDGRITRGETHRGMNNVHPFTEFRKSSLELDEVLHRYFIDGKLTKVNNNISIITDVNLVNQSKLDAFAKNGFQDPNEDSIIPDRRTWYIDSNQNKQQDVGEYIFHLAIF